jgi:hypothetical protein
VRILGIPRRYPLAISGHPCTLGAGSSTAVD